MKVHVAKGGATIIISVERPVYTLDELLEDMTPEAVRDAWSWGLDVGREFVESRPAMMFPWR